MTCTGRSRTRSRRSRSWRHSTCASPTCWSRPTCTPPSVADTKPVPAGNGALKKIKLDGDEISNVARPPVTALVDSAWHDDARRREIARALQDLEALGPYDLVDRPPRDLHDRYYDTPGGDLVRHGVAVRLRTADGEPRHLAGANTVAVSRIVRLYTKH